MTAYARRWWDAVRAAEARRLSYESLLAIGASAATVGGSLSRLHSAPLLLAFVALSTLVLVPLRLVFPAGALLAAALVATLTHAISTPLLLVLSVSAGYRMRSLPRAALTFGSVLACLIVEGRLWGTADLPFLLLQLASFLIVNLLPAGVGRVVGQRRDLIAAMHERNVYLREQQAVIAEGARSRERDRIARELHDSLGNRLTLISLYAGALHNSPGNRPDTTVELLREATTAAMGEVRQILGILRPAELPGESDANPSLDGVEGLIAAARSTATEIILTRHGTPEPLPPVIEHAAFRAIQEGLTNALRHARGAAIQVALRYEPDAVVVEVVNGPGGSSITPTTSLGLIGLAERVRLSGGVLYHGRLPDQGFRLAATLPRNTRAPEPRVAPASAVATDDVSTHLRQSASRSRSRMVILAIVIVIAVCGFGAGGLVLFARKQTVSSETYDALAVGQSESQARARLPKAAVAVPDPAGAPPAPRSATCVNYLAGSPRLLLTGSSIYRFCFHDGKLVTKEALANGGN